MSQRSSGPGGRGDASRAAEPATQDWNDDWPDDDEWPDDLWPDDDGSPGATAARASAGAGPAGPGSLGAGRGWPPPWPSVPPPPQLRRRLHPAVLAAIALTAAGIGAVIVLAVLGLPGSSASPASQPSVQAPAQPGGNTGPGGTNGGGAFPGGSGAEMFMGGRVTEVNQTSITIGGPGRGITAKVTASTRFPGKVSSISGVKVGDQVTAQLMRNGNTITAVSITDPAQFPAGGGQP